MGALFKIPGVLLYIAGGLWGLVVCLGIIYKAVGFIGAVIALLLFPVALYIAPWYAGFADGNWFPVLLVYGSGIGAAILFAIGSAIDGE